MPSTRGGGRVDYADGLPNDFTDDSDDPDYREDSEEDDRADDIPKNMQRDRAQWICDNQDDLEWLFNKFREEGRSVLGSSFLQTCTINNFANFIYRFTTPFSEP